MNPLRTSAFSSREDAVFGSFAASGSVISPPEKLSNSILRVNDIIAACLRVADSPPLDSRTASHSASHCASHLSEPTNPPCHCAEPAPNWPSGHLAGRLPMMANPPSLVRLQSLHQHFRRCYP